jgi:IS5 family transposase
MFGWRVVALVAGQKRRMTETIRREMRRRSAIEPVIGHAKSEHRMDRNYLAGQAGNAINAVLAAIGYSFRRLLAWFTLLLSAIWIALAAAIKPEPTPNAASSTIFTDDGIRGFARAKPEPFHRAWDNRGGWS